ncbi:MAG: LicD family protein [Spirochaetaceae bacterium]|nr:LicD family protein [Spirochaetaceae bacterium]
MRELNLQEIQQASFQTFLKLDSLCRKLNLHYFLAYGTLIGAIRHNGFIPWDDDIDVMMLRPDLIKLAHYLDEHLEEETPFRLCTRENTKHYNCSIPRFVDNSYRFISNYPYEKPFELGAFVDIYPLDPCGNSVETGKLLGKKIRRWNKLFMIYLNPNNGKKNLICCVRYLVSFFMHVVWGFHYDYDAHVQRYINAHTKPNDTYVGVLYDCDPIRKDALLPATEHLFEGHQAFIPKDYDEVLNLTHKGYMTLPPEKDRAPHHQYSLYH